ncbi:MAG: 2,3-bisphosphoglycerate-independent phosphoglycerate mutase [Kiritimatiellia bacterium]|jgi:2,3-bisphosphoglycerate-independent phosphoglycerate mutase
MKTVILIGDGMGDYPNEAAGNQTPLQSANIPHMRRIAAAGTVHMLQTAPDGMFPGSDVCNLGLLGYNPSVLYTGRAPIEAAGAHIPLQPDDVAVRCNLVNIDENDVMRDYSAGHISSEEGIALIQAIQEELGADGLTFYPGVQYRHILVMRDGPADAHTHPPHEIPDLAISDYLPNSLELCDLMMASRPILEKHPVNLKRIADGKLPATQIWLWGQGRALHLPSYQELYGLSGGMITAVDLLRGCGVLAGLEVVDVEGANGLIDTNYAGKVAAALQVLRDHDFVYVHVEAPDECGHMGDLALKTQAIELFDEKIVGPVWQALEDAGDPYRIVVTMDHRTPVSTKRHSSEPVPLAELVGPVGKTTRETAFDEFVNEGVATTTSWDLIPTFLKR